ncbi:MAG: GNAT family N-acetyltransferase [Christensenella sp.]|nr:GNAT family N-acetyltransferase [Christensenella sp.]
MDDNRRMEKRQGNAIVTFCPVTPDEVPELVQIRLQTRIETYNDIYPREWIDGFDFALSEAKFRKIAVDPDQRLLFINVDGVRAGYLCFGREMEKTMPENSICINMLYLLRDFQRRGIGSLALEQVRDYCNGIGQNQFYNGCNMHNENALRFYRKMGGRVIAEYGGHENHALDQTVFEHLV